MKYLLMTTDAEEETKLPELAKFLWLDSFGVISEGGLLKNKLT